MSREDVRLAKLEYYDHFYGQPISDYGMLNGYVDYACLAKCGNMILCNNIAEYVGAVIETNWGDKIPSLDLINGNDYDDYNECTVEIFQWYIIDDYLYSILERHTDEIVYYYEPLGIYIWAITHYGTSWDYVLTDIPLERRHHEPQDNP